jgi:hypothetical protein
MAQIMSTYVQSDAQPTPTTKSLIEKVPVEIVLEIMEVMSPQDLGNFGLVNKHFHQIYTAKRTQLLLSILRKRPELELLLHLYMANGNDFRPERMLHPLTVTFSLNPDDAPENKVFLMRSPVHWKNGKVVCPEKVRLNAIDLVKVAELSKVVDWWVEVYPRLRWRDHPEDRRCLKYDEETRLRKAIARWWLYSHYFHGDYWRNTHAPKRFDEDVRLHHVRILTTQETQELDDFLGTMYETVSKDLCSSPGKVYRAVSHTWRATGRKRNVLILS